MSVVDRLVQQTIEMAGGASLRVLQPDEAGELPDDGPVEWAPIAPYWAVLWRSGVALAQELAGRDLSGTRVIELGCGLGAPSIAAARAGAEVLATDVAPEALTLVARSAEANSVEVETAAVNWRRPAAVLTHAPFDLVLAADVLYDEAEAGHLLELLPRLAPEALIADPGRRSAEPFLTEARARWPIDQSKRGVVTTYRLRFA